MGAAAPLTSSTLVSRRDLGFLLYEWLDIERLLDRPRYAEHSREVFDEVLGLAERVATERFAPHNRAADEREPHLDGDGRVVLVQGVGEALQAFFDTGLAGASLPAAYGGMDLPHVVDTAAFSFFQAANCGTAAYAMLTVAAVNLLVAYGSPEQVERFVEPMLQGRYFGTMCLSETQAGSSLSDITTRALPDGSGAYRLFGSKMWISGGEHELAENIIHLVLAKLPDAPTGAGGVSLFIVPRNLAGADGSNREPNDVTLAGLNHKMGYRGTVNTILVFGEGEHQPAGRPGAVGYLVGKPHRGLSYMFHMMNEARIGVGLSATALGYAGYLKSLRYARQRQQGRTTLHKDPTLPQVPIIEHPDVRRMLLAQKSYVEGALGLMLYCARLLDDERSLDAEMEREQAHLLLELLTPIAKSWPAQWCLRANSLAIQVHGGYGYARDYEVEQLYRDNRLNAIHEGTHGIQALDLLGRKVRMHEGAALNALAQMMRGTIERARTSAGEASRHAEQLSRLLERLIEVTSELWENGHADEESTLAQASMYLETLGHIVVAWVWLEQLLATAGKAGPFYEGKRAAARFFYTHELTHVAPQLELLGARDRTALDTDPGWL